MPAKMKLEAGPAAATRAISRFGLRNAAGFTITGFAHPNPRNANAAKPNMSMCFKGFNVSRPWRRAVSSPKRYAAYPCENSCTLIHSNAGIIANAISTKYP